MSKCVPWPLPVSVILLRRTKALKKVDVKNSFLFRKQPLTQFMGATSKPYYVHHTTHTCISVNLLHKSFDKSPSSSFAGLGNPSNRAVERETSVVLQSVFPPSSLAAFVAQPRIDKRTQLRELTAIVTGIRDATKQRHSDYPIH